MAYSTEDSFAFGKRLASQRNKDGGADVQQINNSEKAGHHFDHVVDGYLTQIERMHGAGIIHPASAKAKK